MCSSFKNLSWITSQFLFQKVTAYSKHCSAFFFRMLQAVCIRWKKLSSVWYLTKIGRWFNAVQCFLGLSVDGKTGGLKQSFTKITTKRQSSHPSIHQQIELHAVFSPVSSRMRRWTGKQSPWWTSRQDRMNVKLQPIILTCSYFL